MVQRVCCLGLAAVMGLAASPPATAAAGRDSASVVASEAWVRLPPPAAAVAAGYVELHNGGAANRLVAASAAGFGQVQIHAMRMDGEVMRMQALPDGLPLPAGKTTSLRPGGYHLMLMMPKRPLQEGQHVRVRLQFAHGDALPVAFVVRDGMGGPASQHGAHR
ncbi:copper chaperone PCu(A)C [Stenotrophomonas rhizophila]